MAGSNVELVFGVNVGLSLGENEWLIEGRIPVFVGSKEIGLVVDSRT